MCRGLGYVEETGADGCVTGCVCCPPIECEARCEGLEYQEERNSDTGCVDDCQCICPQINCADVCKGADFR